ncbi:lactose-binding lectin l-2-like isoform X2 [Colossoma macropomum]|uniref:lactose-binding lectin l-2-like isoform X2 n=1 Tax=Colossoma macropomum TaxID=42526 RepID=UPI00186537EA|nr:lactose-binding lectin l-2-like isoform X2 [Colossoma macropomum]
MVRGILLFVLFVAASASDLGIKPVSEADFNALIKEQVNSPQNKASKRYSCIPNCPYGWVKFDGRCFNYFSIAVDWASAEAYCLTQGANLVSIHSENEYQMVKALVRAHDLKENPTWLGLSNCQKKNSWFWSDGTMFMYRKWNKNEPNHKGECCVHMNEDHERNWNDIPCDLKYPFVCVKRLQ